MTMSPPAETWASRREQRDQVLVVIDIRRELAVLDALDDPIAVGAVAPEILAEVNLLQRRVLQRQQRRRADRKGRRELRPVLADAQQLRGRPQQAREEQQRRQRQDPHQHQRRGKIAHRQLERRDAERDQRHDGGGQHAAAHRCGLRRGCRIEFLPSRGVCLALCLAMIPAIPALTRR